MSAQHKVAPVAEAPQADACKTTDAVAAPVESPVKTLVTARNEGVPPIAQMMQIAATRYGKAPVQLLTEFARLSIGAGKLSIDEYFAYGLYDDKALAGADKSHFAGLRAMRDVWLAMNWDEAWDGVFTDKLALEVLFRGYGLPTTQTIAVYTEQRTLPAFRIMSDVPSLAQFLRDPSVYPLFGKPFDSIQSLGSASFERYDAATDEIVGTQGGRIPVELFAQEVKSSYAAGYLFQKRISPHPSVRAVIGERLSTVRVMTVLTKTGPEILRVLWKIPAGDNVADNFWRSGNMIAQLDPESGRVLRVIGGVGINAREFDSHPDTGAPLIGYQIPDWNQVKKLALVGAGLFTRMPLIGWDIGLGENGPLIVEPNNSPDFGLPQIADRRGLLDDRLKALVAERKAEQKAFKAGIKADIKRELREARARINKGIWN